MITFLCNVTKVPSASNISYFVHALQDHRRRLVRLLEFIHFDPRAVQVMPLDNFKKDPPGLWLIIQNSLPFSWLKSCLDQHDPSRKNIKTTNDIFSYIKLQCKLLKDQEIEAKQTQTTCSRAPQLISSVRIPVLPATLLVQTFMPLLSPAHSKNPLTKIIDKLGLPRYPAWAN